MRQGDNGPEHQLPMFTPGYNVVNDDAEFDSNGRLKRPRQDPPPTTRPPKSVYPRLSVTQEGIALATPSLLILSLKLGGIKTIALITALLVKRDIFLLQFG